MALTRRHFLYLAPLALFLVLAGYLLVGLGLDPRHVPSVLIDKPVPAFALEGIEGGAGLSSDDLKDGEVKLVNFFASWCVPCRAEHPFLMRLGESGVKVYGINQRDKPEDATAWLAQLGNPFAKIGADRKGRVGIDFGVYGLPESFVVDGQGRIRHKVTGPITNAHQYDDLIAVIESLRK